MPAPRSCTSSSVLVQFVCVRMAFLAITNSVSLEPGVRTDNLTENEPLSTFSASDGYQNVEISTGHPSEHLHQRRLYSTVRIKRFCGEGAAFCDYLQGWRSIFKNVSDYYDSGTVLVVGTDGTAQNTSIQDADDQVPEFNTKRVTIYVRSEIYEEKVIIPATKPYSTLHGEGRNRTIFSWQDTAPSAGILLSASDIVESIHFKARDISFRNSAEPPANMQEEAIRISGDYAFLHKCNFFNHQDILYDHQGRHYYFRCCIQDSEDFISGAARSLFETCWLNSIAHGDGGTLVAQGKSIPSSILRFSGFSFLHCHIKGTGMQYLGRAWGQYSTVVYSHCQIDANIRRAGWYGWGLRQREGTVFLGRCECTGRGVNSTGRVSWSRELTAEEARLFTGVQFVESPWWPPSHSTLLCLTSSMDDETSK